METKYKVVGIILVLLMATGIGVVIYQYSQGGTSTSEPTSEPIQTNEITVPSDISQYTNTEEITETMSAYQDTKMKEISIDQGLDSFRVEWEMKGSKTTTSIEIGNTVQIADNSEESITYPYSDDTWQKVKEIQVDKTIKKARLYFKMLVSYGSASAIFKVNGEIIGDSFTVDLNNYKSFAQDFSDLSIESGDKVQLYIRTSHLNLVLLKQFQIRYDIVENVAESDVNYQIKINGVPETSWKVINSRDYTSVTEDIFTEGISADSTIELWVMTAQGVEVSVKNMEICYEVRQISS